MDRLIYLNGEEIGYILFRDNIVFNITKDCDIEEYNELVQMVEERFIFRTRHYSGLTLELIKPFNATIIEKINNNVNNIKEEESKLITSLREELKDFNIDGENIIDIFKDFSLTLEDDFKEPQEGYIHSWDESRNIPSWGYLLIMRNDKLTFERYNNTFYTNGHSDSEERYYWDEELADKDIIIGYTYNNEDNSLEDGGSLILFTNPYVYRKSERIETLSNWEKFIEVIRREK